jgi:hypothetical protein
MDSGDEDGCKGEEDVEIHHVEAREFRFASRIRASFTRVGQHHHPAAFHSLRKLVAVSCGHVSNANSISSAFNSQRWPNSSTSRGPKSL